LLRRSLGEGGRTAARLSSPKSLPAIAPLPQGPDNEVSSNHPLIRRLEAIRRGGAGVNEIVLVRLTHEDLPQLTADPVRSEPEHVSSLAQLLHEKTAGNPFLLSSFERKDQ
jgi:predicted ATPase